jgi:rhodanese-related sulfurtransferase
MKIFRRLNRILLFIALLWMAIACSTVEKPLPAAENESQILLNYLEENGDFIIQQPFPFFVEADELFQNLRAKNYLVIDIRPAEEFENGHIENAVNIAPENILDYFENRIEPNSFEKISVVCNNAHHSGYVVAILRILGYNNTFNMRFGMSAWHEDIAERAWLAGISDDLTGKLEITWNEKNETGNLPVIQTGLEDGYSILRQRAQIALELNWQQLVINHHDILARKEDYYIINYWTRQLYEQGHLPGAVLYLPRTDLSSNTSLLTLPVDKPLVIYCYTGHTAVYVNAFLALLGYDFRTLEYCSNGFNYWAMATFNIPTRTFSRAHIRNYPLIKGGQIGGNILSPIIKTELTTVSGGC